ncbi:neutrophil cytosol factor 2 isoform X1 [Hydra vulgaris]|uniref:neutrophil cytosol factor 2 isoform X1 n=2 Tax=Hydra vulgaris TaxID=6087 RepID=UPI001F5FEC17|nr:neutrophil cytosol factor 2 isoform X1 [Hydra vulgaris]
MNSASEIEKWSNAVNLYDNDEIEEAIKCFKAIPQNAKISFNISCCYLALGNVQLAAKSFQETINLDPFMAIAYYMLGLTNCLDQDYISAFENFQKTNELLRGNRMVDYRQLGLNFQLYQCEILTNQAYTYYRRKNYRKAKVMLLLAINCKVEKRHENIVDFLNNIQAGTSIKLFVPSPKVIYRPSKLFVENLKKKDFLGKSTVIATENEDNIYICFSGLKEKFVSQQQPIIPNRKTMLEEIRQPERKKSLKHIGKPPNKQLPILKAKPVFDIKSQTHAETNKVLTEYNYKLPPKPVYNVQKSTTISDFKNKNTNHHQKFSMSEPKEGISTKSNNIDQYPPLELQEPKNTFDNNYFILLDQSATINNEYNKLNFQGNEKAGDLAANQTTPIIKNGEKLALKYKLMDKTSGFNSVTDDDLKYSEQNNDSEPKNLEYFDIEVQYTFTKKVRVNPKISLYDVENLIKSQTIPTEIELCYSNELGRQQKLNEKNLLEYFQNSSKKKLLCFST